MVLNPTIETIVFLARRAIKLSPILMLFGVEHERKLAIRRWTPREILLHIHSLVKSKGTVLSILIFV